MPGGRPTKYCEEMLWKAKAYLDGGYQLSGEIIPTLAGLALHLGVSLDSIARWESKEEYAEFSGVAEGVRLKQHAALLNGGLTNVYNPNIAKLMLTKHGYTDKQETKIDADVRVKEIEVTFKH